MSTEPRSVHSKLFWRRPLSLRITFKADSVFGHQYGSAGQNGISSMTLEEYRAMDEVHNIGSFLCVRAVLQAMLQQEPRAMPLGGRSPASSRRGESRGSIVVLTSLASEGAFLRVGNYIAAKHAVKGLVQTAGKHSTPCERYYRMA